MKMILCFVLAGLLAGCGGGGSDGAPPVSGASAPSTKALAVIGDSLTLRTGLCGAGDAMPQCASPQLSYATHVDGVSGWAVVANAGRGGDTCTKQAAFDAGPFKGQARGIGQRLGAVLDGGTKVVSVLAGANDVNAWGVSVAEAAACVRGVWAELRAKGVRVVAMTYPPIDAQTQVWGADSGGRAAANVLALNEALRYAARVDGVELIELAAVSGYGTSDGAHPTADGARVIAAVWLAGVRP